MLQVLHPPRSESSQIQILNHPFPKPPGLQPSQARISIILASPLSGSFCMCSPLPKYLPQFSAGQLLRVYLAHSKPLSSMNKNRKNNNSCSLLLFKAPAANRYSVGIIYAITSVPYNNLYTQEESETQRTGVTCPESLGQEGTGAGIETSFNKLPNLFSYPNNWLFLLLLPRIP